MLDDIPVPHGAKGAFHHQLIAQQGLLEAVLDLLLTGNVDCADIEGGEIQFVDRQLDAHQQMDILSQALLSCHCWL